MMHKRINTICLVENVILDLVSDQTLMMLSMYTKNSLSISLSRPLPIYGPDISQYWEALH